MKRRWWVVGCLGGGCAGVVLIIGASTVLGGWLMYRNASAEFNAPLSPPAVFRGEGIMRVEAGDAYESRHARMEHSHYHDGHLYIACANTLNTVDAQTLALLNEIDVGLAFRVPLLPVSRSESEKVIGCIPRVEGRTVSMRLPTGDVLWEHAIEVFPDAAVIDMETAASFDGDGDGVLETLLVVSPGDSTDDLANVSIVGTMRRAFRDAGNGGRPSECALIAVGSDGSARWTSPLSGHDEVFVSPRADGSGDDLILYAFIDAERVLLRIDGRDGADRGRPEDIPQAFAETDGYADISEFAAQDAPTRRIAASADLGRVLRTFDAGTLASVQEVPLPEWDFAWGFDVVTARLRPGMPPFLAVVALTGFKQSGTESHILVYADDGTLVYHERAHDVIGIAAVPGEGETEDLLLSGGGRVWRYAMVVDPR